MLRAMIDEAMRVTGADMANLQLLDPTSRELRIEAQRGFSEPFLSFFKGVHDGQVACGTALTRHQRVIVVDVTKSPIFLGRPALDVMLEAGVRAVQSTPLVGSTGSTLGVISTHWCSPWHPSDRELLMLHLLARAVGEWIESD